MKHVSVNFIPPDKPGEPTGYAKLMRATWLVENAAHHERMWPDRKTRLCVVLVGNTGSLPPHARTFLQDRYDLIDAAQLYEEISREHPGIAEAFGGIYNTFAFAFFRWILIDRLFPGEPVACYDGDIVQNVDLDALSRAFQRLTRTATSTAFAVISDRQWFAAWADGVKHLERDSVGFFADHAHRIKHGRDQFLRSPEEYFAKFLIEVGALPNDELPADFPYWIVPQPQNLPRLNNFFETKTHRAIEQPMTYAREGGVDQINGRPLAFWHMQKPFMSQLSCLVIFRESMPQLDRGKIYPYNFYGKVPDRYDIYCTDPLCDPEHGLAVSDDVKSLATQFIGTEINNFMTNVPMRQNPFHPRFLYDYYFTAHDFSLLFNNARWPSGGWSQEA